MTYLVLLVLQVLLVLVKVWCCFLVEEPRAMMPGAQTHILSTVTCLRCAVELILLQTDMFDTAKVSPLSAPDYTSIKLPFVSY